MAKKDISTPTHHLIWGKLHCVVIMWFEGFDRFLTDDQSMAKRITFMNKFDISNLL